MSSDDYGYKLFSKFGYVHYGENVMKVECADNMVSIFEWEDNKVDVVRTWFDTETRLTRSSIEPLKGYSFLFRFLDVESEKGLLFASNPIKGTKKTRELSTHKRTNWCYIDSQKKILSREGYKLVYEGHRNEG